jgi:M6 family metalloprotease-like protein
MKSIITKIFCIVIFTSILSNNNRILAIQATPDLVTITLPDKFQVKLYIKGDENIHWFESPEQFTLLKNDEGYFVYATLNAKGDLIPSKYRYWNDNVKIKPSKEKANFLNNLQKKLSYSKKQIESFINANKLNISNKNKDKVLFEPNNIEGTRKYLVALMEYSDLPFTKTREDFDRLFNEIGYQDNGYGSIKDFYIQQSYGKFTPEFIVVGPFTTQHKAEYYKSNSRSRELVIEAVENALYDDNIKMADFDNDYDGYVDAVSIIFAGWGEEAGFQEGIWSHASQIINPDGSSPSMGGRYIRRYCCSPELQGNNGSRISTIGVSTHEFCHTLGAPDYYDVDYAENGSYQGAGEWCLMASGSWNGNGNCPAGINVFQKWLYGWIEPINLTTENMNIQNMPNSAHNSVAYRIDTDTPDEFYIMENRQKVGFDKYVPGHGLLIWHIHSILSEYLYYGYNGTNSSHPQTMYPVCAASTTAQPNQEPNSYGNINSRGTPFPGYENKTEFTDNTIPAAISWDKKNINRPITNISEVDSFINFKYGGRPAYIFQIPYFYDCNNANHFSYYTAINSSNNSAWGRVQDNGNNVIELRSSYNSDTSHIDHYLFLPAFQLYKNYAYIFNVDYKMYSNKYPGNMKLYLCNTKDIDSKILIKDFGDKLEQTNFAKLSAAFNVPNDGIYYIVVSTYTKGDYMDLYLDNIDVKGNVGIAKNVDNDDINIFPNPTKSKINIISDINENIDSVEIINIDGKSILTTKNATIDISNLNQGAYIVKIKTNNKTYSKTIVKE